MHQKFDRKFDFHGRIAGILARELVPEVGIEPTCPQGRWILNPVRLPVPPLGHAGIPIARRMAFAKNYWRPFGCPNFRPFALRFASAFRFGGGSSDHSLLTLTAAASIMFLMCAA
jgi:hypothetical protein